LLDLRQTSLAGLCPTLKKAINFFKEHALKDARRRIMRGGELGREHSDEDRDGASAAIERSKKGALRRGERLSQEAGPAVRAGFRLFEWYVRRRAEPVEGLLAETRELNEDE